VSSHALAQSVHAASGLCAPTLFVGRTFSLLQSCVRAPPPRSVGHPRCPRSEEGCFRALSPYLMHLILAGAWVGSAGRVHTSILSLSGINQLSVCKAADVLGNWFWWQGTAERYACSRAASPNDTRAPTFGRVQLWFCLRSADGVNTPTLYTAAPRQFKRRVAASVPCVRALSSLGRTTS
jgi:hypothetical protein